LQLIGQFSTSIHPTQYPQCLSAFTFGSCISPSGVSILLQSIGLYIWLIHQPMRCICFIVLYRPIQSLGMGPYILIAISYYIGPYSPLVWAHTYSLQFLIISANTVPQYGPIHTHCNFCCNRPRSAGSMLSGICTCRGLQCYR